MRDGETWVGDHDVREGLRFRLRQLRENGSFVTPWPDRNYKSLVNYQEGKSGGADFLAVFRSVHAARVARLPEHVRAAMGPANA